MTTLGELAADVPRAITDGPFGSNLTSAHYTESGPHVVRLQNIGDGSYVRSPAHISPEHFELLQKHEVLPGDLLVASLGEVLPRACLAPDDLGLAIVKADCIRVRLSAQVNSKWVLYSLQRPAARRWAEDHRHGVGRPRLGLKGIRALPVPLPSLAEQRRITEFLEGCFSRLDAAEAVLSSSRLRLEGLFLSAVEAAYSRIHDRLALKSPDRASMTISQIAGQGRGVAIGPFGSNLKVSDYRESGVPLVFVRDVRNRAAGGSVRRFIDSDKAQELRAHSVRQGDVLVTKMGDPPGDAAVYSSPEDGIVTSDVIRVRPASNLIRPEYLAYAFSTKHVKAQVQTITNGVAQKKVSLGRFREGVRLPVPDLSVQDALIAELDEIGDQVARLGAAVAEQLQRSAALRRAALASAFSGQLTGRASDMEGVEELAGV